MFRIRSNPNRKLILASSFAFTLLGSTLAHAVPFQEGQITNCPNTNRCVLPFAGPGPGKTLTVQNITCRLTTNTAPTVFLVDLFDSTHALFLKTEIQDTARRTFVASASGPFRTGGNFINVTATLGIILNSQLACTIDGQST